MNRAATPTPIQIGRHLLKIKLNILSFPDLLSGLSPKQRETDFIFILGKRFYCFRTIGFDYWHIRIIFLLNKMGYTGDKSHREENPYAQKAAKSSQFLSLKKPQISSVRDRGMILG